MTVDRRGQPIGVLATLTVVVEAVVAVAVADEVVGVIAGEANFDK